MASLDPQLRTLLASLRRRVRQYILADSLMAMVAVVLAAFWIGLAIDFLPVRMGGTEMPRSARVALLMVVLGMLLVVALRLLLGRLRKPLPDDSLALLVERHHPALDGRLVTAVQLSRPDRSGDACAPALLRRVHAEAASAVGEVDWRRIFRWRPLARKTGLVIPMLLALVALAVISPGAAARATGRLLLLTDSPWPRKAELVMVGIELPTISADEGDETPPRLIEFVERRLRLPRGSSGALRIAARSDGRIVPDLCTVYYTGDDGTRGQANMRRVGRVTDGLQSFVLDGPPLTGLSESLTISVRGLDARLDSYRIEAVEPPAITQLTIATVDPPYLHDTDSVPPQRVIEYQSGLRVREGSQVLLTGRSSRPLSDVDLRVTRGGNVEPVKATISEDGSEFFLTLNGLREGATIVAVPRDRSGISAQLPYRYYLGVVVDERPEIEMRLRGIGSAVTAAARIPVEGRVSDDYGIDRAGIDVAVALPAATTDATLEESPANDAVKSTTRAEIDPDREGRFELAIDLRELAASQAFAVPQPGGAVNLIGEVSDRYDLDGRHESRSELFRLEIVTPENLLALLERRELGLRSRLEQTIDETRQLRDSLDALSRDFAEKQTSDESQAPSPADPGAGDVAEGSADAASEAEGIDGETDVSRDDQVMRLRTQQIGLQATKTGEELTGIVASLNDLLEEMVNNRVDSVDRSERIGGGVRDPLQSVIDNELDRLRSEIAEAQSLVGRAQAAAEKSGQAVQTAEEVLLQLAEVLEKMLDLESYNEILDMVRDLIENQEGLLEETKQEQKRRVLDLFE